jgi:hypothetical protein
MKRRFMLLLPMFIVSGLVGGALWLNANSPARAQAEMPPDPEDSGGMVFDLIDEKALNAKDGSEFAVSELADEVFNTSDFAAIPDEIREKMKDRVLRAELMYRKGGEGIEEDTIVKVVNEYADKFTAPDYAKTSSLQVRYLRATLMRGYPNFISQPKPGEKEGLEPEVGTSINPTMSPLEAAFVTAVLLQQKMLNEEYQKTPQEWADSMREKQLEEWQADANRTGSSEQEAPSSNPPQYQLEMRASSSKYGEMMQTIHNSASTLWASDLQAFVETALDDLGIPR